MRGTFLRLFKRNLGFVSNVKQVWKEKKTMKASQSDSCQSLKFCLNFLFRYIFQAILFFWSNSNRVLFFPKIPYNWNKKSKIDCWDLFPKHKKTWKRAKLWDTTFFPTTTHYTTLLPYCDGTPDWAPILTTRHEYTSETCRLQLNHHFCRRLIYPFSSLLLKFLFSQS